MDLEQLSVLLGGVGQHHQLLPFVHNAKHEEENIHLLLPLVQVMPQSSSAKLTGATIYLTTWTHYLRVHLIFSALNLIHESTSLSNILARHSSTTASPSTQTLLAPTSSPPSPLVRQNYFCLPMFPLITFPLNPQFLGKALEFPSITLVIFLLIKAGRRLTLILFYTMAGVGCS